MKPRLLRLKAAFAAYSGIACGGRLELYEPGFQPTEALDEALALIGSVPGYEAVAAHLEDLRSKGKIRIEAIADRGTSSVWGVITLGPEALAGGAVGLAETLVHERFHLTQAPLAKTASFWGGVFSGTPIWRRLERPAYRAAVAFLDALAASRPELSEECHAEAEAVRAAFLAHYGAPL